MTNAEKFRVSFTDEEIARYNVCAALDKYGSLNYYLTSDGRRYGRNLYEKAISHELAWLREQVEE